MSGGVRLVFPTPPSMLGLMPKIMLARRPVLVPEGREIPRLEAEVATVTIDARAVARYRSVCGFGAGEGTPITYPHVLAGSLQLALLCSDAFPVRLMGLVHMGNRITQYSALPQGAPLSMRCRLEGYQDLDRGHEFALNTEVRSGESVLWEEITTFLARRPRSQRASGAKTERAVEPEELDGGTTRSFHVAADIGRRYALVSGDYNPIHLSMPTARLFGFPKAIAHGMWSLARCVAEVEDEAPSGKLTLDCSFRLPVLLPAWVMQRYEATDREVRFELRDQLGERAHLTGCLART